MLYTGAIIMGVGIWIFVFGVMFLMLKQNPHEDKMQTENAGTCMKLQSAKKLAVIENTAAKIIGRAFIATGILIMFATVIFLAIGIGNWICDMLMTVMETN